MQPKQLSQLFSQNHLLNAKKNLNSHPKSWIESQKDFFAKTYCRSHWEEKNGCIPKYFRDFPSKYEIQNPSVENFQLAFQSLFFSEKQSSKKIIIQGSEILLRVEISVSRKLDLKSS